MTTIHEILTEFREAATSNRDMGDKFERLIATYLITDPLQAERFDEVWLWSEWPHRGNQPDTGIDLVAKERATGEFAPSSASPTQRGTRFKKPTSTVFSPPQARSRSPAA